MNTAAKGARNENRSKAWLESRGFDCTRSAASKGPWDLIAIDAYNVVLVQVRTGRWPSPAERWQLAMYGAPAYVHRELHRWMPRAKEPDVLGWNGKEWADWRAPTLEASDALAETLKP